MQIGINCESWDKNVDSLSSNETLTFDTKGVDTAEAPNNLISIPQSTCCLEAKETSAYKAKECDDFIILDGNSVWTPICSVSGSENVETTEYTINPEVYINDDNQHISEKVNSESSLFEIKSVAGSLNRSFREEPCLSLEQKKDSLNLLEETYEVEQRCSLIAEDFERRETCSTIPSDVAFEEYTCCIESNYTTLLTAEDLCSDNCNMNCEVYCEEALVTLSPVDDNIDKHPPGRGQNLLCAFMGVCSSMDIEMKSQAVTLEMNVCDVIKLSSLEIRHDKLQSEKNKSHMFRGMDFEYSNHHGGKEETTWSHESLQNTTLLIGFNSKMTKVEAYMRKSVFTWRKNRSDFRLGQERRLINGLGTLEIQDLRMMVNPARRIGMYLMLIKKRKRMINVRWCLRIMIMMVRMMTRQMTTTSSSWQSFSNCAKKSGTLRNNF